MTVYKFKVCVVGDQSTGKTSLINRYVNNQFSEKYVMTIGSTPYNKTIHIRGDTIQLVIWDVMGNAGFRNIIKNAYFYGAHGLLAVGDLTRPETFESLVEWVALGIEGAKREVPVVMVANKRDLEWKISEDELVTWAAKLFARRYYTTSAKMGEGVTSAFRGLAREILKMEKL